MKKALLFIGSIALCLIIFIAMPYCLLKNSFSYDCESQASSCSKTIEHKINKTNTIGHTDFLSQDTDTTEDPSDKSNRGQFVSWLFQNNN
ncbi:hypothetical protein JFL43_17530 [Viridibacillus sp. YIM B01967]|uniref:Lipoprotein n=1 Tax=Viridibacillus soli TaxID=2798301 RepID=A0ABS1HAZ8_9BACL|nr:hypothetical protein [Viridibacillus soli]MBK3496627.1 hypothetical protein [Viridibacillus soli]